MAMPELYSFETELEWTGRRAGRLSGAGFHTLEVSAPVEFSGDPGVWTPEHLLIAAVSSCLMTTFLAIADLSKLPVISYRAKATGTLGKVPGEGYRFTTITLAPEVGASAENVERAQKAMGKAEKNCFISNSLRAVVRVNPHFVAATAEVAG